MCEAGEGGRGREYGGGGGRGAECIEMEGWSEGRGGRYIGCSMHG